MLHEMTLFPKPYASIASGQKTIELRLYDEKAPIDSHWRSHSIYQYRRCFANNTVRSGSITCL